MVPPKQNPKPSFGAFVAPAAALVDVVDRAKYAGLPPSEAAVQLLDDYKARTPRSLQDSTRANKTIIMRKVLTDLATRGYDLASVTPAEILEYRAYLKRMVDDGHMDEDYCVRIQVDWNAAASLLFGDSSKPIGTGLRMKTFRQTPKEVQHLDIEDIEAMIRVLPDRHFMHPLNREAVHTYLEMAIASAGRWSSIGAEECTFGDVDWVAGTILFRVVKNREKHCAVLTERCVKRLRDWRRILMEADTWKGESTPIMTAWRGVLSYQAVSDALKDLAALAGIRKPVTTHVTRKSVATHVAKYNPRLAREQLGITPKVFERNYNQPTVKDRIERRDLLIGAEASSKNAEERIGALYLRLKRGDMSQQEFDREVHRGLLAEATLPRAVASDPAVA